MATSEIRAKFGASTAFAITLASLASSTSGVGRQSDMVPNTACYTRLIISIKLTQGTSTTGMRGAYVYLIRGDGNATPHRSDGAGASDAALTVLNARLIGTIRNLASGNDGVALYGEFVVDDPGPQFGIAIVHDTGANLNSTAGNHWARYVGVTDEAQ